MPNLRKTPLHSLYKEYGDARCVDFGGWELPVQFSGITGSTKRSGTGQDCSMSPIWASFSSRDNSPEIICSA